MKKACASAVVEWVARVTVSLSGRGELRVWGMVRLVGHLYTCLKNRQVASCPTQVLAGTEIPGLCLLSVVVFCCFLVCVIWIQ